MRCGIVSQLNDYAKISCGIAVALHHNVTEITKLEYGECNTRVARLETEETDEDIIADVVVNVCACGSELLPYARMSRWATCRECGAWSWNKGGVDGRRKEV